MNKQNIILIGFMGCGKTTFGKWITDKHDMAFLDTDEYIENKQKTSIKEIFATKGELAFRDMETETIKSLIGKTEATVISVGGGLPVREENRALLKELGYVVYLETTKDELVNRLKNDTNRPLLAGGDLIEKIDDLMQKREALYKDAADLILHTDGLSFEEMYNMIMR